MPEPSTASQSVALFEGDIMVSAGPSARSISLSDNAQLWPSGIIPYAIDPTLPERSIRAITAAIKHWNEVGGISLLPLTDVSAVSSTPVTDFVNFIAGDYCASWVGKRGGEQSVWIAPHCPAGSVMHEIGHLLGLEHEHTRPDRDQYIQIHWNNIEPDKQHNFDAAPAGSRLPGAYDYDSIMHYGSHNFSSNGQPTISAIDGLARSIGQRIAPSEGDLHAIAQLYGSDLSLTTRINSTGEGAELDIYVSNESVQGAHELSVIVGTSADPQFTNVQGEWTCSGDSGEAGLVCHLPRLRGGEVERLTISLPGSRELPVITTSLTSKTPDSDLSNNISRTQGDDTREVPEPAQLAAEPGDVFIEKTPLQEDAMARVVVGGGAISVQTILVLLILLERQTGGRVNRTAAGRLFSVYWRQLFGR